MINIKEKLDILIEKGQWSLPKPAKNDILNLLKEQEEKHKEELKRIKDTIEDEDDWLEMHKIDCKSESMRRRAWDYASNKVLGIIKA